MSDVDPFEERRLRLEQAEREARGDFSTPAPPVKKKPTAAASASSLKKDDDAWLKYKKASEDTLADESNPNAILNRQHNNLRAQAQVDLAMQALLDTSMPRQDR